jgi:hypothetical protein
MGLCRTKQAVPFAVNADRRQRPFPAAGQNSPPYKLGQSPGGFRGLSSLIVTEWESLLRFIRSGFRARFHPRSACSPQVKSGPRRVRRSKNNPGAFPWHRRPGRRPTEGAARQPFRSNRSADLCFRQICQTAGINVICWCIKSASEPNSSASSDSDRVCAGRAPPSESGPASGDAQVSPIRLEHLISGPPIREAAADF